MPAPVDITSDLTSGEFDGASQSGVVPIQQGNVATSTTPDGTVPQSARPDSAAPAPAPEAGKSPSLRDTLSAAFKGETGDPAAQADATNNTGQPKRNPDGTFAPKGAEAAPGAVDGQTQGQPLVVQPPKGLSHEELQTFNSLPAEMQQYVARTMEGLDTKAAKYQSIEAIDQLINPRRQAWAMNGMTEQSALTQLFALSDFASSRPTDFVRWFAGQQGIDLAQLVLSGGPPQQVDPVLANLQQQVGQLTSYIGQQTQAEQQRAFDNTVTSIAQFAQEKGANGQPLRPYFEELGVGIKPYIVAVKEQFPNWQHNQILQEAYDRACWATPAIRARLQTAAEAQRVSQQVSDAGRARAASASVTGAPHSGQGQAAALSGDGSLRDTLRSAFAQSAARV